MPHHDPFGDLIAPFSRRGVDLGLGRLQRALAELGHPERRFAAVQVAGTNGKGSISTMLERIATAAGIRCGLYTSPHLLSWCERIRLPSGPITEVALRRQLEALQGLGQRHDLTPFELITAAGFVAFAEAGVELAVLEVGLGGRLDATTTHPDRSVLAIGSIGMDHTEHLGPTLAAIAAEKAGVFSRGAIAVSGAQDPAVARVLERQAATHGTELRWVAPLAPEAEGGPVLGLRGDLQRHNAAVAVGAAQALAERGWPIDGAAIRRGLAEARWPGRLERRSVRGRPLLVDGAHNPPAAVALRQELDGAGRAAAGPAPGEGGSTRAPDPRRWLIGIQRHKDAPALLRTLLRPGDAVRVVALPEHRSWSAAELGEALEAAGPDPGRSPESWSGPAPVLEAGSGSLEGDLAWLADSTALPVVAGSLYLVAAVLPLLDP
ncbi:bifunctional folylpolyglutamate synthase/dihydrofolate synthase [Vulcanococcus limneticus Candia 3F8]|uniref:bifunctional folylpolyglutamate synthase/dihydrofolate synthase n=1 Tax=Vulcanococcus limneticus TaxID=2170428 RepID=UPI000B97D029|nr:Mur ligase family protein [Vulcanococcus limneticus]MCP9790867.1 bifunctional folylpolyglutamate synthase/dihydrofolate synthase [Vulcanococcus limneticus MW73D5]MCP9892790.1 bifunctional folylpolyglutamate synthase/dihydrofolate synthase [Vulcanococcus limneticus Candia 3F8]MCP9896474.1 bifunctional folylpolyglutamate synthase/dihydrofolate synthase [Vulcanococcus limneticus Candia 3B3]